MPYAEFDRTEMDCSTFKIRLDALLDARQTPQHDGRLRAHARICPECARWLSAQSAMLSAAKRVPVAHPSPDFSLQVLQKLNVERRDRQRRSTTALAFMALAASLLVAVLAWRGGRSDDIVNNRPVASNPQELPVVVLERVEGVTENIKPMTGHVYTALNAIWLAQRIL